MDNRQEIRRAKRRAEGLCIQCGDTLDRVGRECSRCNASNNDSKMFYHIRTHAWGKCTQCLKPLDRDGWYCTTCTKTMNINARERNMYRRKNGLCVQCGTKVEKGSYCRRCLDMRSERYFGNKKKS